MSETWYKTGRYTAEIEPIEVERHTAKFVWVRLFDMDREPRQVTKHSDSINFWPTWLEAANHIEQRLTQRRADLERQLARCLTDINAVKDAIEANGEAVPR